MDCDVIGSERHARWESLVSSKTHRGSPVESGFDSVNRSAIKRNITRMLNSLEAISREISEGKSVDLCHTSTVVDMLDHAFHWIQIVSTCELLPTLSWKTPEGNGANKEGGRGNATNCRKKWFNQMRESLARISLYPEDLHCRVDFVHAAVECMDYFRRHVLAED